MASPSKAGMSYAQYDAVNGAKNLADAWSRYKATQARTMTERDRKAFAKAYTAGQIRYSRNPARALKPNRLTPVAFTVKGKRHTGKAKLVGGKVKVFVTANVARRLNPGKLYFNEYMQAGSGHPVDMTMGLQSMAQARSHGLKVAKEKGYSGFWISSKPAGETSMPKRLKFIQIRRRGDN